MPSSQEIFNQEFEAIRIDLIKTYNELGMRASGQWEASTEVQTGQNFGRVLGASYTEQLEDGRKAGKMSPISAIKKWIIEKGIIANIGNDAKVTSLAFAIAKTHKEHGWKRDLHGGVNLVSRVVTPQRIQKIINKLGTSLTVEFSSELEKQLKLIKV